MADNYQIIINQIQKAVSWPYAFRSMNLLRLTIKLGYSRTQMPRVSAIADPVRSYRFHLSILSGPAFAIFCWNASYLRNSFGFCGCDWTGAFLCSRHSYALSRCKVADSRLVCWTAVGFASFSISHSRVLAAQQPTAVKVGLINKPLSLGG